jgi:MFS family permease
MPVSNDLPLSRRLLDAFAMFMVAALSMVLLIYVAFGEAKRNYEQFQIEKLVAQGQVVQNALETFIRPGLPARQFVGFQQLAEPMVKADPLIDAITFHDVSNERVFTSGDGNIDLIVKPEESQRFQDGLAEIRHLGQVFQVVLPVRNRFEQVGHVVLSVPRAKVSEKVEEAFKPVAYAAALACFVFAFVVFMVSQNSNANARNKWIGGAFVAAFLGVAVVVVSTLISVYAQGAQARAKSLADSLGQRLDDLVIYNINMDDVTGIIQLFGDYKRLNPDIRAAALIVDGKIRAHVDPMRRGTDWDHQAEDYEYTVSISQPNNPRDVVIKVALPRDVVMKQIVRSVKNFTALLVASAFFAALFMGLARSLKLLSDSHKDGQWSLLEEKATINLVKPVFFLAVFVEHLSYAFLPTLMQASAKAAGLAAGFASLPFVAYYLMFAVALYPAGRYEQRVGARNLIMMGLVAAGGGLAIMSTTTDFWTSVLARGLSGVGQGILFIGVQAYILANSSPGQRTQAGGAIVFGFQAGMIAGMAIGSLLVSYLGSQAIFLLGAAIAGVTLVYGLMALPSKVSGSDFSDTMHSAWGDMKAMIRSGGFARTVFLVGIPAKAVLTGVILFGMPILLAQSGFAKEDIGQITMLYAGCVIIASHFASIRADELSETRSILFNGVTLTAVGLALLSAVAFAPPATSPVAGTMLIIAGVALVGVAHGYINAPIITHITNSPVAGEFGMTSTAAAYRLLERVGHVLGPIIVGQLFLLFGASWTVIGGIALGIFLLGAFFFSPGDADAYQPSDKTSISKP